MPVIVRRSEQAVRFVSIWSLLPCEWPRMLLGLLRAPELRPTWALWVFGLALTVVGAWPLLFVLMPAGIGYAWHATRGERHGLGAYDTATGKLVGGLTMRVNRRRRVIYLAGLYVKRNRRKQGIARQLAVAALDHAPDLLPDGGTLVAYAPVHRASHKLAGDQRKLTLGSREYRAARDRLARRL